MTVFLTSSPTGPLDGSRPVEGMDESNHFAENLRARWKPGSRCLIAAAGPEDHRQNDEMVQFFAGALERSGLSCTAFDLWDSRNADSMQPAGYDVLFLGGGHVPTQNHFFRRIGLRAKLQGFDGLIIGISAGTMNAADRVYAQPELPGESVDPGYVRWYTGLGLTDLNLIPHYQMVKDNWLDGRRLYEDITYSDSVGHRFVAIPDGSYLLLEGGRTTLWGEGWQIADGQLTRLCGENCTLTL